MTKVKLRVMLIVSGILFFLIYVFLGAKPLSPSLRLDPAWTVDITDFRDARDDTPQTPPHATPPVLIPYKLGQTMGYFTPDGKIDSLITFPFRSAISGAYHAAFLANAQNTEFYHTDGSLAGVIRASGFPYFDDDRIVLFHPGGAAFSLVNPDGVLAWTYEGYAPISAFESSKAGIAMGCVDGVIRVFAPDSNAAHEIIPGGSTYPVILGADISPDGKYVASVSGIGGQRFVLTKIEGGVNKVLFHRYISDETREQTLVQFNAAGTVVYYNSKNALCVFDSVRGFTEEIPFEGELLAIAEMPEDNFVFALTRVASSGGQATYTVWVLEDSSKQAGSFSFTADHAFIRTSPGALYVGKDTLITRINVSH
jgi:hypothetical protein